MSISEVTAWQCSFCKRLFKVRWAAERHAKKCPLDESLWNCHTCLYGSPGGPPYYCKLWLAFRSTFLCDGWTPKKKVKHGFQAKKGDK